MIKCIAIDMDGTLLNQNHVVSKQNADAIKLAQQKGIEVVIATGRSYKEASPVLKEAGIETPIICVNGAEVRSVAGEVQYYTPLHNEEVKKVVTVLNKHDIYFEMYTQAGTYSNDYDKALATIIDIFASANRTQAYEEVVEAAKERFTEGNIQIIDSYEGLLESDDTIVYKLLAFSLDSNNLENARNELKSMEKIAVSASGKENIEITSVEAQKGIALTSFTAERNISMADAMAIGDNFNDISMLERAGHSVAMGNAPDEVKNAAKSVTDTNINSGVAKAILNAISE
ncbi:MULTISPECIES: Cof-type HAD-IIB family hydrolase [Sutcliffiella]|uniref:Hydrolase n=1 Tax=Sutcliffiella cohnii TaxID=33932 RepID=A0A223KX14_9BACI|nr:MULTISPECIES: Cof-type HAD-IIB family hydrolase [Sutcliffiella]AST93838.1 hydrolase [Sutcliffiella cohnii]MED4015830.1 Cof-type HAD-IIB family hydrolase [Sutcliffiella cohnii]WBL15029.1 Cof-type HAD-IIB family hydrolase [Sutcliffiella sp. NC1]